MISWVLRAIWISLPVTAGQAFADAIDPFGDASRVVAAVLLWALWAVVLAAVLVPRPVALTVSRLGIPVALAAAVLSAATGRPSALASAGAIVATAVAAVLGTRGEFARACAQGAAYGDEERFPLKVPLGIGALMLPTAVAIVGIGLSTGPLLLADEHWLLGAVAVAVGFTAAALAIRMVHQLSQRWIVLVPAGLVVADPLTLTDPVLFVRNRITGLGPADPGRRPPDDALDLRLGAAFGSCALLLNEEADVMRRVRGRGVGVQATLLLVTPGSARRLLDRAAAHRIPVRRA